MRGAELGVLLLALGLASCMPDYPVVAGDGGLPTDAGDGGPGDGGPAIGPRSWTALASGASEGLQVMRSARYLNLGALGEGTPPGAESAVVQTSARYTNLGGFQAVGH